MNTHFFVLQISLTQHTKRSSLIAAWPLLRNKYARGQSRASGSRSWEPENRLQKSPVPVHARFHGCMSQTSKQTKYDPPAHLAIRTRDDDVPLFRCLLARERGTQTDTAAVAHVHARPIHANLGTCTTRLRSTYTRTRPHTLRYKPTDQSRTISRSCMNAVVRLPPDSNPSRTQANLWTHTYSCAFALRSLTNEKPITVLWSTDGNLLYSLLTT